MADNIVYVGDRSNDAVLNVTFREEMIDGEAVDFIRIQPPGDPNNIIDEKVDDYYRARFASQYDAYKNGANASGTPLKEWADISGMIPDLERMGFRCVEQIANAPDASFARIMGGIQWRNRANAFLASRNSGNVDQVKKQAEEIAELRAMIAAMQKTSPELVEPTAEYSEEPPRKRRGRKAA